MVRPSRRGKFRPLSDTEATEGVVDGDDIDWDSGVYTPTAAPRDQWKQPVRCATTADITIATALNAGDTIDGVTLAAGDRVLVKDQGSDELNGIYIAGTTPVRAVDMDDDDEVLGALVYVLDGTANGGSVFRCDLTDEPVIGTDPISFAPLGSSGIADILDLPTAETDTALVLAPDGAGGVEFRAETGGGVAISSNTPVQDGGAGSAGTGTDASADDHKHPGDKVAIMFHVDGGGSTITTGAKGVLKVPFACTITESEIESDATTNTTLTIKKRAYGGGAASSIVAAALPTLSGATENKDSTLSGWTTSVSAGDKLYWEVTTNSAAKLLTSTLTATRT